MVIKACNYPVLPKVQRFKIPSRLRILCLSVYPENLIKIQNVLMSQKKKNTLIGNPSLDVQHEIQILNRLYCIPTTNMQRDVLALQSHTVKYRVLTGKSLWWKQDPCNENRDPCNENRFFPMRIYYTGKTLFRPCTGPVRDCSGLKILVHLFWLF